MKKKLIIMITFIFLLSGCGKTDNAKTIDIDGFTLKIDDLFEENTNHHATFLDKYEKKRVKFTSTITDIKMEHSADFDDYATDNLYVYYFDDLKMKLEVPRTCVKEKFEIGDTVSVDSAFYGIDKKYLVAHSYLTSRSCNDFECRTKVTHCNTTMKK